MIVFDEIGIVEAHPVVLPSSHLHRMLLQAPPAGEGLARVQDLGRGAADGLEELVGEGGDSGKVLKKIQGDPFGGQNRSGLAFDRKNGISLGNLITVLMTSL